MKNYMICPSGNKSNNKLIKKKDYLNVALLSDSFFPSIDGVANTVINYANNINKIGNAIVITPYYPEVKDEYSFSTIRYNSIAAPQCIGYRVGIPFNPKLLDACRMHDIDIIHCHSPFASVYLAKRMKEKYGIPVVFTYHTKYDVDLEKRISSKMIRKTIIKKIVNSIEACDDVWVVSEGAGLDLQKLGYHGKYTVMKNGTDLPKARAAEADIFNLKLKHGIEEDTTVFLFVGRMMWYKGVRLILDGMREAKSTGFKFVTIFVGDGGDRQEIEEYSEKLGLKEECIFIGVLYDRKELVTYYSIASLLVFPSTYDTNGLVVREAAACACPSMVIQGSCAAEGVIDRHNSMAISETADAVADGLVKACKQPQMMMKMGLAASNELYQSWEYAVEIAYARYQVIVGD